MINIDSENAMICNVRATRVYSAIEDSSENEAKEKTKFPDKNFPVVIDSELMKGDTDILIVQSGSVDITNMKTKGNNPMKYGEYFKQQTIISATNLFSTVSKALSSNPSLQKVIIMKLVPRYDSSGNDPQSIKAALAQLFNDTLLQLWLGSSLKEKIVIGSHRLECTGGVRYARYMQGKKYDGIHMYGPAGKKAYTESVLSIIRDAGYIKYPPPQYFLRFHKSENQTKPEYVCPTQETDYMNDKDIRGNKKANHNSQYAVPTNNRFNIFNQKNC